MTVSIRSSLPFLCLALSASPAYAAELTGHLHGCIEGQVLPGTTLGAIRVNVLPPRAYPLTLDGRCFSADLPQASYLIRANAEGATGQAPLVRLGAAAEVSLRLIPADGSNPELARKLHQMAKVDQQVRKDIAFRNKAQLQAMAEVDKENEIALRTILKAHGWPSPDLVGLQAVEDCWLLVQHGPSDLMEAYLPAMQKAAERGELSPAKVALTVDRVMMNQGKEQIYGSQFRSDESGELKPYPIEDPDHLDERRAQMGLGPYAEYRKLFEKK